MSVKHGLGKGMMALVDENELKIEDSGNGTSVDIHKILPNRYQPRKRFTEESLKELPSRSRKKA